jgi:hypothetical protein
MQSNRKQAIETLKNNKTKRNEKIRSAYNLLAQKYTNTKNGRVRIKHSEILEDLHEMFNLSPDYIGKIIANKD